MESINIYPTANIFCTSLNDPLAQQDSVTFLDIRQRPIAVLNSKLPVDWPLQIRLCTNTSSLIREAVSKGILCALLPQDFVRDWDDVAVLPFNPPQNCAVKAVWNKIFHILQLYRNLLIFFWSTSPHRGSFCPRKRSKMMKYNPNRSKSVGRVMG